MSHVTDLEPRFQSKIEVAESGCWEWTASISVAGYGKCWDPSRGSVRNAHRVVWESLFGSPGAGLHLDHLCRNRACVNPAHMEPVTPAENQRRGKSPIGKNMLKTHCVHGHPFAGRNLLVDPTGYRRCRTCAENQRAAYRARKAVAA